MDNIGINEFKYGAIPHIDCGKDAQLHSVLSKKKILHHTILPNNMRRH